jgi:hypothetical protein
MTAQEFTIWLQGYVELGGKTPGDAQWKLITEHLKLVFDKQTPELKELEKKSAWEDKKVEGGSISEEDIKRVMDNVMKPPVTTLPYIPPPMPHPYNPTFPGYDPNRITITC